MNLLRSAATVVVAVLATVVVGCSSSTSSAPAGGGDPGDSVVDTTVTTAATTATGPTTTTMTNPRLVTLEDRSRPVVVKGRTVAATRVLPTLVWLPPGGGPHPLIVFAHGYEVGPATYARFCAAIAAAGYVVAAPSLPAADAGRGFGLDRDGIPDEARDVSFVATSLRTGTLTSSITAGTFGVVGHSDGADVALDVGYASGLADPAVGAVVAISPDAFTLSLASIPPPPLLLMHSDSDPVVPYSESVQVFGRIGGSRSFVTLLGADHLPPVAAATQWTPVVDAATIAFLDATLKGIRTLDAARAVMAVAGVSTLRVG